MKATKVDQSRLLQQTMCYNKIKGWSFSVSWGYTVHLYERIIPPSILERPFQTFLAWRKPPKHPFMFNTRWSRHPCDIPHIFFLKNVEKFAKKNRIVTTYTRQTPRRVRPCWRPPPTSGSYTSSFPGDINKIVVITPTTKYSTKAGTRKECCDVEDQVEKNVITIKYRTCERNEILGDF
ncbi:Voltage-dependent calcium channel unc-36 [Bienertia sinuspersici]